ncbi:MAG: hypothetical protein QHH19_04195 [Candidatus Thermoplasmatota archaeon]|jgi:hypothetical protein|nr:hypothetical protein [Candidatus Thermoplasmatota archaeon]
MKKIIFGYILELVIILSLPCVSSIQIQKEKNNKVKTTEPPEMTWIHMRFINSKTNNLIETGWTWVTSRTSKWWSLIPDVGGFNKGETEVGWE